jgi:hypothetical protein
LLQKPPERPLACAHAAKAWSVCSTYWLKQHKQAATLLGAREASR